MTCSCGRDNRDGASFCAGCGADLRPVCGACGAVLADDARFCDGCGAATAEPVATTAAAGSRKVVTILFADLSGSTSLQEQLDAETTRRVMDRVHGLLRDAVEVNGGRVVKFTGDGVMAVWGVPVLREDDAVRAVRAGAAMQATFADVAEVLRTEHGADIGLRVGVNTGEVVVPTDSDDVVGDPVNVAARLEAAAAPGEVLVGPETHRLARDVLHLETVEPLSLKGKRELVIAARLLPGAGPGPAPATPLVGRDADMATLTSAFDDAVDTAAARLITVVGAPGLGKSRLAVELAGALEDRARVIEVRFVPDAGSSFGPLADALRQFVAPEPVETRALGEDAEAVCATLSALLGGGAPGSTEQVFWAIRRLLESLAAAAPGPAGAR